jgi:hypothetical protein
MLEKIYRDYHNPAWEVYMGKLEDKTPEVVEFT